MLLVRAGEHGYDCNKCFEEMKLARGCKTDVLHPYQFGTQELYRCPLSIITMIDVRIIELYRLFKMGYLPARGGLGDQPALLIDVFLAIDSEIKQLESEKYASENKKVSING